MTNIYEPYLRSAMCANLAYTEPGDLQTEWANKTNPLLIDVSTCPKLYSSNKNTVRAYSWKAGRVFHITFRGTQTKSDIFADIDFLRTELSPGVYVHSGFLSYFKALEEQLTSDLKLFDIIHITGHSLGGAIATLAAATYANMFKEKYVICHTVGSPRVGNLGFVKWFEEAVGESMRITNVDDPVTLFPISPLYTHVSKSMCISDKCVVTEKDADTKWYWRLFSLPFKIDYEAPIADHSCNLYCARLAILSSKSTDASVVL